MQSSSSFPFLNDDYRLLPPAGMESYFALMHVQNVHSGWPLAEVFAVFKCNILALIQATQEAFVTTIYCLFF